MVVGRSERTCMREDHQSLAEQSSGCTIPCVPSHTHTSVTRQCLAYRSSLGYPHLSVPQAAPLRAVSRERATQGIHISSVLNIAQTQDTRSLSESTSRSTFNRGQYKVVLFSCAPISHVTPHPVPWPLRPLLWRLHKTVQLQNHYSRHKGHHYG